MLGFFLTWGNFLTMAFLEVICFDIKDGGFYNLVFLFV